MGEGHPSSLQARIRTFYLPHAPADTRASDKLSASFFDVMHKDCNRAATHTHTQVPRRPAHQQGAYHKRPTNATYATYPARTRAHTHTHTLNVTNRHREGAECKDSRQARVMVGHKSSA